jgi:hypothetical protein
MVSQRTCYSVAGMVDLLRWYCERDRILEPEELWALLDKQRSPASCCETAAPGTSVPSTHDERYYLLEPPSTPTLPTVRLGVVIG